MGTKEGLVSGAGVLNAPIGVVEQSRPGLAIAPGLLEGILDQGAFEAVLSRPANELAAFKVHDGGQVKPPFAGGNVSDIGDPDLVEPGGSWTVVEQIFSDWKGVSAIGGFRTEAAFLDRSELMLLHEAGHAVASDALTLGAELVSQPRAAVGFA